MSVWIDSYPTGRRKDLDIPIAEIPGVDTVPGVQARLKNLGYYAGTTDGERFDGPTVDAIKAFQKDHDLSPTGHVDDDTQSALTERYGQ